MRGRPSDSKVKRGLINILNKKGASYGYELFKLYEEFYDKTSLRNIYHNLRKGVELGELVLIDVKKMKGDYSWGDEVERVYYAIGPYAKITDEKLNIKERGLKIDFSLEARRLIDELNNKLKNNKENSVLISDCNKLINWLKFNINNSKPLVDEVKKIKEKITQTP